MWIFSESAFSLFCLDLHPPLFSFSHISHLIFDIFLCIPPLKNNSRFNFFSFLKCLRYIYIYFFLFVSPAQTLALSSLPLTKGSFQFCALEPEVHAYPSVMHAHILSSSRTVHTEIIQPIYCRKVTYQQLALLCLRCYLVSLNGE